MQSANDRGYLEASTNGVNWTRVSTFTNSTLNWATTLLDLSEWGKTSNLRLRFNANSQTGLLWYVDDVRLNGWPAVASASFSYSPRPVFFGADTTFIASYTSINTTLPLLRTLAMARFLSSNTPATIIGSCSVGPYGNLP
jgi:hypothetical protein